MWNTPTPRELSELPSLRQTENVPLRDKIIRLHFFIGGCDLYAAEFDGEDFFFGYAVLNRDWDNAEWGYFSLSELKGIVVHGIEIDRDLHWQPVCFGAIPGLEGRHAG